RPVLISISLGGYESEHDVIFQCATEPGTVPENDTWIKRKRNTVARFGVSSWLLRCKMITITGKGPTEVEEAFTRRFALKSSNGGGAPDEYALHGGGFPVRVQGVDGVVGVVSV
ncbi:hypothetical protein V1524DRAFT_355001, partial [Lipomyces starkeyi]